MPGTEVAGIVGEVGRRVSRFKPGDRVCAVLDWGGLAEEACANEVNVFSIPDSLAFPRAIAFTNSYATSAAALTWPHLLDVQPGQSLLVHGAVGGVGIAAVEIGKIRGAQVIATAGSANVFTQSLRCMAPEGRIMPVGFASGDIPQIPANILLVKNLTVCGLNMGLYFGWGPTDLRDVYETKIRGLMDQLFRWFEAGQINPLVTQTYPLAEFQRAMADVLARRAIGRIAVVMDPVR